MASSLKHIAIIMDGNRRWAQKKGLKEKEGYTEGVRSVYEIVKVCLEKNIHYLTLFTFSTENWKRSAGEVEFLFSLIGDSLHQYRALFKAKKIKLLILGDASSLPASLQKIFLDATRETQNNKKLSLILAVNYGGRKEIIDAVNKARSQKKGEFLSEEDISLNLASSFIPAPDLIIRTGGTRRLSNFYLWSSAYSELYFTDLMWPDFKASEMRKAISYFETIDRRFGGP